MIKKVSVREFQLKPTEYLKELPIVLTRYNLPVATILPYIDTADVEEQYPKRKLTPIQQLKVTGQYVREEEPEEESKFPSSYLGKPLSGKKATCPICSESVPTEFATQHYQKEHGDI